MSELNISIGYSFIIFYLIETGFDKEIVGWIILANINLSYIVHVCLSAANLIRAIVSKIQQYFRAKKEISLQVNTPNLTVTGILPISKIIFKRKV